MRGNAGDTLSVAVVCSLVSWWSEPPRDKLLKLLYVLYDDHDHPKIEDEDEERPVKDVLDPLLQLPLVPSHWVSWTDLRDKVMMTMKIKRTMLRRIMRRMMKRMRRRINELTSAMEQQPLSPLPI